MATTGCFAVIEHNDSILLVKRRDVPLWDLPGGRANDGEAMPHCTQREAFEETGYHISILHQVGRYHRRKYDDTQYVFLAKVHGGNAIIEGDETKALRWFSKHHLPMNMIPNRRRQIKDTLQHKENIHCELNDMHILLILQRLIKRRSM